MAPLSTRGLLTGVLTALGNVVNNVGTSTSTRVGSTLSTLGTDSAKTLGDFLTNNVSTITMCDGLSNVLTTLQPLEDGFPWGKKTSDNTNYYTDYPNTGVVRSYDWTITKQTIAPDGVNVTGLLVNGQYPGPLLEANWGDSRLSLRLWQYALLTKP